MPLYRTGAPAPAELVTFCSCGKKIVRKPGIEPTKNLTAKEKQELTLCEECIKKCSIELPAQK